MVRMIVGRLGPFREKPEGPFSSRGMTLPEVLIASSLAVLLLGLLLTWSIQGQMVIREASLRSEELQELNQAMKVITDTLQDGAVYLLEPYAQIMTFQGDGSFQQPWPPLSLQGPSSTQDSGLSPPGTRLLVECFVDLYKKNEVHEFLLKDGYLFHRVSVKSGQGHDDEHEQGNELKADRDAAILDESGEQEEVLALNLEQVTFSCPVRGILEITIKGETLLLTTQIRVKEGKEDE